MRIGSCKAAPLTYVGPNSFVDAFDHPRYPLSAGRLPSDIRCLACIVPGDLHAKRLLLVDLITTYSQAGKTIVFCNTKRECETVVSGVSAVMPAEALHGDIQQDMREYTMSRFREVRACCSVPDSAEYPLEYPRIWPLFWPFFVLCVQRMRTEGEYTYHYCAGVQWLDGMF
jgi:hypothetical protein